MKFDGGDGAVGDGTRATLGNVRGGTVSDANGGVGRSETVPGPELPRHRQRMAPSCAGPARWLRSSRAAPLPCQGAWRYGKGPRYQKG